MLHDECNQNVCIFVFLIQMCSPACTELEVIVMDWLGKFLGLSDAFLNCSHGPGGGVIQGKMWKTTIITSIVYKIRLFRFCK